MTTWNKTGVVVGGLDKDYLRDIILHCKNMELKKQALQWLEGLWHEGESSFTLSLPYRGKEEPTVEE